MPIATLGGPFVDLRSLFGQVTQALLDVRRDLIRTDHQRGIALQRFGQLRQLIRHALAFAAELPRDDGGEREQHGERPEEHERGRHAPRHRVLEPRDEWRERERQHAGDAGDHENVPERAEEVDGQAQRDEDREHHQRDEQHIRRPPVDQRGNARATRRPAGPAAALQVLDDVVRRPRRWGRLSCHARMPRQGACQCQCQIAIASE